MPFLLVCELCVKEKILSEFSVMSMGRVQTALLPQNISIQNAYLCVTDYVYCACASPYVFQISSFLVQSWQKLKLTNDFGLKFELSRVFYFSFLRKVKCPNL